DSIGQALWPRKKPQDIPTNGTIHALRAGLSLMFRLWRYIPLRQRNIREMTLQENLYRDTNDQWRICFSGSQLQIATKRGRLNRFDSPFPSVLVSFLEEYLQTWRPILAAKTSSRYPLVFLTQYGTPYKEHILRRTTGHIVYSYTGKHWHPHIVRTVWAT